MGKVMILRHTYLFIITVCARDESTIPRSKRAGIAFGFHLSTVWAILLQKTRALETPLSK